MGVGTVVACIRVRLSQLAGAADPLLFRCQIHASLYQPFNRRHTMQWTTPSFTDLRFGFEITMYIANR